MALRKKRVTISEQAQAAIASGMSPDQALAESGTPVPEASAESTAESTPAPAASDPPATAPIADPVDDEGAQDPNLAEAETPAVEIEASSDDATITTLLDRMQTAQSEIAAQAATITQLEADADALQATHAQFMEIAVAATNRMQIGLGGAASDLSSLSAENLLAQYQSTLATFEKRIPVGGKAEVLVEDEDRNGKVVPLVSPAAARATQFHK